MLENEHVKWHKNGFRHPSKYSQCCVLSDHFNKGMGKVTSFKVQIIEKIEESRRTNRGNIDTSITQVRKRI